MKLHLERMNDSQSNFILKRKKTCLLQTCFEEMAKNPFGTIGNKYTLFLYEIYIYLLLILFFRMYFQYSVAFEDRHIRFFIIKQPIAKSFVEMLMVKGFPLRDRIDQKIR